MKTMVPIWLAVFALMYSSLACASFGTPTPEAVSVENLRLAHDEFGMQPTSIFSPSDVIFAVAELKNAPQDAEVKAVWTALDATDSNAVLEFQEQTLDLTRTSGSGTIYFRLSNDAYWPSGLYRVEIFLNDEPVQSLEFSVE